MRCALISLTLIGLLTTAAGAQPEDPGEPAAAAPATPAPTAPTPPSPAADDEPALPGEIQPAPGFEPNLVLATADGRYSILINGRIHAFYTLTRDAATDDFLNAFSLRQARLALAGNLHGDAVTYRFQLGFDAGAVAIKDAHVDVQLADETWLRFGQWKAPFSRQFIASTGRLELTDRAITDRAFGASRDVGIALRNDYERSPEVEWVVGVFNGFGEAPRLSGTVTVDPLTGTGTLGPTTSSNVPRQFKPLVVARIGINRGGIDGYDEADLVGGPLRWGIATSVWLEGDLDDDNASNQKLEIDYIAKVDGFSTSGGLYAMSAQTDSRLADAELARVGFHLQAAYLLAPTWLAALRYAFVDDPRQKAKTLDDQQEISLGGTYLGRGHDAKVAAAIRLIKLADASFTDTILFEVGTNIGW